MWGGNFMQPLFAKPVVFYVMTRYPNEKNNYYMRGVVKLDSGVLIPQVCVGRYRLQDKDAIEISSNILRQEVKGGKMWSLRPGTKLHTTSSFAIEYNKRSKYL